MSLDVQNVNSTANQYIPDPVDLRPVPLLYTALNPVSFPSLDFNPPRTVSPIVFFFRQNRSVDQL